MHTYTHTVHTHKYTCCGTAWVWSSSVSAVFSELCLFHSWMHFHWSKTKQSFYPRVDSVEASTLEKFLFCKHYATAFLLHVLFHLLDLELRERGVAFARTTSDFMYFCLEIMNSWSLCCNKTIVTKATEYLFRCPQNTTMFTFLLLHKFCYNYYTPNVDDSTEHILRFL